MPEGPDEIEARSQALLGHVLGGRYRLDAVLGMGAMGAVFRARHTGLERDVALKLLHHDLMSSDEMRARFAREAAAISKLDHPNCVRVSDFGIDGEHQYLVMELLQGAALGDQIDDDPLPPAQAAAIIDEVLAGLEHAHGHGLVHRDIKPDNIFMVREGSGRARVKLLDFGIVKLQEQEGARQLTQMGMIFGTPCYMSPEQATGATVDARADLYAVGIILYQLLAGRLPFDSDDPLKVLRQQIRDAPPPLPASVPAALREVVDTLVAKKPEDRYPSAAAARQALARVLEPTPLPALPVVAPAPEVVASGVTLPTPPGPATPAPATLGPMPVPPVAPPRPATLGPMPVPPVAPPPPVAPVVPSTTLVAPPSPPAPGPAMAPRTARAAWPPPWWPPGLDVRWVAGGLGALVLLVIVVVATGGDDEASTPAEAAPPPAVPEALTELLGSPTPQTSRETDPAQPSKTTPQGTPEASNPPSARTSSASLEAIDVLVDAQQYEAARISLGPLLEAQPGDARLHWRMAKVLTALGGVDNRIAALGSHASAIEADAGLLDDEAFMGELSALLDDPALRDPAVVLALEHLEHRADDRLIAWLNVQVRPLDRALRHRVIAQLRAHERDESISEPLQQALDLWQAREAEDPCEAFDAALRAAEEHPDSFLVGTLQGVTIPAAKVEATGAAPEPCPGAAERLVSVRNRLELRYAGIDPVVPKAYHKRPVARSGQSSRRRRR